MAQAEQFINVLTNAPTTLANATNSVMGASGTNHAAGLVPDTGNSVHSPAWVLGDDAVFHASGSLLGSFDLQQEISGGGGVITSGNKGWLHLPCNAAITNWLVLADQSGSIVIDILRANLAFPSASLVGAGNMPTLSSAQFAQAAPSGWTSTALVLGDYVAFNVTGSPSSVTQVTVTLTCTRTS